MALYPKSVKIDLSKYSPSTPTSQLEAKYGLPQEVRFCKTCVISNQRPTSAVEYKHTSGSKKSTIHFGDDGVCDACKFKQKKDREIDWERREYELKILCDKYRSSNGSFDCIVPGSGGKDSFYTSHLLKYKYGMHPLTVTWAPHMYTEWGWRNFQTWIGSGFDNILYTPNTKVHRLLTRLAVENLFHPFQPFFLGQKSIAPKYAALYKIPLVFYGENEAEYGNAVASAETPKQDWKYFTERADSEIFIGGTSVSSLMNDFGLVKQDLIPYMPANPKDLERENVEVHYFGYYTKWHPQNCYYYAVEHGGFEACPERNPGTYSKYASVDDKIDDFNFITTYTKFGIGRTSYDASQEVRSGDITREEGVSLIQRFDGEYPARFEKDIFNYLSIPQKEFAVASKMFEQPVMNKEYFDNLTDRFRSPHLWKYENGKWSLRHTVWQAEAGTEKMKDYRMTW